MSPSCLAPAGDGVEYPQATGGFSAPDMLAALVHLNHSSEKWTKPVNFIEHDKWSIGCILSCMLSGCLAFDWPPCQAGLPYQEPGMDEYLAYVQQRQKEWVSIIFSFNYRYYCLDQHMICVVMTDHYHAECV